MPEYTPSPVESSPKERSIQAQALARALITTHERYDEFYHKWELYLDCYQGINIQRRIFRHLRESAKSLQERVKRSYYLNYCEPVVDLYAHYIFSKPVIRKFDKAIDQIVGRTPGEPESEDSSSGEVTDSEVYSGDSSGDSSGAPAHTDAIQTEWEDWILKNVDRRGNGMDRFMAQSAKFAFVLGHVCLLIDMPSTKEGTELSTEQNRLDAEVRPYIVRYMPQSMTNFAVDEFGKLLWCRFREDSPPEKDPFKLPDAPKAKIFKISNDVRTALATSPKRELYFKTWTRTNWYLHKVSPDGAELKAEGEHPVGEVPVIFLYNTKFAKFELFGHSLICDIAKINIAILNWSSLIDEEIYQKCLNILCMATSQGSKSSEIVIGENNTLEYEGQPPFFLSPATDPGAFIQSQIDRMRDEIFRLAKLGGGLGIEQRAQQSGVAHAFEFNETNRTLAEKADELERAENRVHELYHKWLSLDWKGSIDYPDTFSIESFDTELQLVTLAKQAVRSETFHREQEKKIAKKMLHNSPDEIVQKVMDEIDELPSIEDQQQEKQAALQQEQDAQKQKDQVVAQPPSSGANKQPTGTPPGKSQGGK